MTNVSKFLRNVTSEPFFTKLQHKKINVLLEKDAFEVILISNIPSKKKIFNSCFVNKIKNEKIATVFEKSRHVVQACNNHDKEKFLIQSPIIQWMSLWLILALAIYMPQYNLYF